MKKSSLLALSSAPSSLVSNSEIGQIIKVLTLVVSNTGVSGATVDVEMHRFSDSFKILKGASIPAGRSLSVFVNKDFGLFLESGDELRLSSPNSGLEAVCSYEAVDASGGAREAPAFRVLRSLSAVIPEEDLTECPAGPCLGSGWFCCPDNVHCADLPENCPSWSGPVSTYSYAGTTIVLSDYFGDGAIRAYEGTRGSEILVPEGFSWAVFINSYGQVSEMSVSPGDVLTFRSIVVVGPKKPCDIDSAHCANNHGPGWTVDLIKCECIFVGCPGVENCCPEQPGDGSVNVCSNIERCCGATCCDPSQTCMGEGTPYAFCCNKFPDDLGQGGVCGNRCCSDGEYCSSEEECEQCSNWGGESLQECGCCKQNEICTHYRPINPDETGASVCCRTEEVCGDLCCAVGEVCQDGKCCTLCGDNCCLPNQRCQIGPLGEPPQCVECEENLKPCGDFGCCPLGKGCFFGDCIDCSEMGEDNFDGECCPSERACGEQCCPVGQYCEEGECVACNDWGDCPKCCKGEEICVGYRCCLPHKACGITDCCEGDEVCIEISEALGFCCAPDKVCGSNCCSSAEVCIGENCCPNERACGDACCGTGQSCVNGVCVGGWAYGPFTCPDGGQISKCRPDPEGTASTKEECEGSRGPGYVEEKCMKYVCINGECIDDPSGYRDNCEGCGSSSSSSLGPCERLNLLEELGIGACCVVEEGRCLGIVPEQHCFSDAAGGKEVVWVRHGLCGECRK